MSKPSKIIVVAPNYELRRSIEFGLEVEGFAALSFESISRALASSQTTESICVIIDDEALVHDPFALVSVRRLNKPVLLLVDRAGSGPQLPDVRVIRKPVLGNALIKAVKSIENPMP